MNESFKKFIGDAAGYVAVAAVSLIYIAMAVLVPGETGKSMGTIIADGAASFLLGICINFNLNMQGILKGERSDKMIATKTLHGETVGGLSSYIHRLDDWCEEQNALALRTARSRILMQAGMRYADCFDKDGVPLELDLTELDKRIAKRRRRAMKKAVRLQLSQLSSSVLTGNGGKTDDPHDLGENVPQYIRHTNTSDVISKLLVAMIFGYYGVRLLADFSYAELIWRSLQVAILLAMGVAKQTRAYLFMVDTYRGNIVRKINYLQSFENWAKASPESEEGTNVAKHGGKDVQGSVCEQAEELGKLQDRAAKDAGSEAKQSAGTGQHQPPKAVEIPARADCGV